jgi:hypothetical protein
MRKRGCFVRASGFSGAAAVNPAKKLRRSEKNLIDILFFL